MKKQLRVKSKRMPLKLKYTIQKKMKEHRRKQKKEAKKNPQKNNKPKKDLRVPNIAPFKEQVLLEMEQAKRQKEAEKAAKREEIKQLRKAAREGKLADKRGLLAVAAEARQRDEEFEANQKVEQDVEMRSHGKGQLSDTSAKAFYKEFRKVVEAADVILEVLDARDPIGTRCHAVEQAVVECGPSKRLVFVLNKADLVPKENLSNWIKYLRQQFPAIAFKASTQVQSERLGRGRKKLLLATPAEMQTSKCLGADTLMKLLGNYSRNKGLKTAIRVGVVGMPNVGKSSIINSLKRSKACNVGAVAGVTKTMQEVALDSKILLLDSPGLILASSNGKEDDTSVALRNAISLDNLDDPVAPVQAILNRTGKQYMMLHYSVPDFSTCNEFLARLARRLGQMRKGGIPDMRSAAKRVLQDWTTGKIKYYTLPPESNELPEHLSAAIVQDFGKEFSLDDKDFQTVEEDEMADIEDVKPSEAVLLGSVKADEMDMDKEENSSEDEDEEAKRIRVAMTLKKNKGKGGSFADGSESKPQLVQKKKKQDPESLLEGNQKMAKLAKLQMKKEKKERARRDRVGQELSADLEAAFSGLTG